jgi:hypothetical protein
MLLPASLLGTETATKGRRWGIRGFPEGPN